MSEIVKVEALEDYRLKIELSNRCCIVVNLKPRLMTARFSALMDWQLFASVTSDGLTLFWGTWVSMSLEEVFDIMRH